MSEIPKAAIYTKNGDSGQTSLVDGKLVPKFHSRVHAYGDVDELNSALGVFKQTLHGSPELSELNAILFRIQNHLFNIGSLLACEDQEVLKKLPTLSTTHIEWLEKQIDLFNQPLPTLKEFILPGGQESAAWAHMSRTICRRAERNVAEIHMNSQNVDVYRNPLVYLNRLSDFFFTTARWIHFKTKTPEIKWDSKA